ncbi:methionine aminotransferase [Halpernia frigidisoli]|uniref:Methionine aminotransferase n=1 Tax=Halpernia frigidisoli TaxID=1125876 RepID=A0A1I3DN32_9FLAO|nr:methionine aminotransferase [Halpernia frigidisoli]SFH88140.1 methionine aminotransferase [Halpernia frigidisoli]
MINLPTSKLPDVKTTIFTQMSLLAQKENAINLSQGFPDFEVNKDLSNLVDHFIRKGFNQYAPMIGVENLRVEILNKYKKTANVDFDPNSEITITAGGTEAIFSTIATFIEKDDEVILFEPAYDCYEPTVKLFGGKVRTVQLNFPDFTIDWDFVKSLVNLKTKMIIINNPNNPTGKVLTIQDISALIEITKNTNILILSDEVYESIVFDSKKHLTFLQFPELKERTIVAGSFGKLFHVTGWKTGFCIAPKEIMAEIRKVHQFNVFSVNTPTQYALAEFLKDENNYLQVSKFYEEKRDYFKNGLETTPFSLLNSEGTYFLSASYESISNLPDLEFCTELTIKNNVATIPYSAFYSDGKDEKVIRFCFAKKKETLDAAIEKLQKINF